MEQNLVAQSNTLLTASYALTLNERRLLLACISQLDSRVEFDATKPVVLTIKEAYDLFFTESDEFTAYRYMRDAMKNLFKREITFLTKDEDGDDVETLTRWISTANFNTKKRQIEIYFAVGVLPYLTELKNNFTRYKLIEIAQLSSSHAVRLYEILVMWMCQSSSKNHKEISINEFKHLLAIQDKYTKINDLKRVVLDICERQINDNTNLDLKILLKKYGKTYEYVQFYYNKKPDDRLIAQTGTIPLSSKPVAEDVVKGIELSDKQRAVFGSKLARHPAMADYAKPSENYKEFGERLALELANQEKIKEFMPYLEELGFKQT